MAAQKDDAIKKKAARFATLKRDLKPIEAEAEQLADELKAYFREHPEVTQIGEIGFAIVQRKQLDTKAVRAELGARIGQFERANPVETLYLRQAGQ